MDNLRLVTPPLEDPVSLAELKSHLQKSDGDTSEDSDLALKLSAASAWVRGELGRPLITSTWDLALCRWPCRGYLDLPCNTQSITSVKYTDSAGVVSTVDPSIYKLARAYDPATGGDSDMGAGRLYLAYGKSWPSATLDVGEPITIRLIAGWADAASVPVPLKQAVLMLAAHWYRNRDAVIASATGSVESAEIALGVQRLCSPYEDRRW